MLWRPFYVSGAVSFLFPLHILIVVHGRDLIDVDTFGALLAEENTERGKAELQVCEHAHIVDIEQVELQLLIGLGIIFAIDLGIACEACLHLQAQLEVRELLIIFLGNFGPLGARANNRHVPHEDIPELGQLVQAALADKAADRRDAGIVVPGA